MTTEYTGTEAEIRRKMENKDYNWVPYLATEAIKLKENFDINKSLEAVRRKIEKLSLEGERKSE